MALIKSLILTVLVLLRLARKPAFVVRYIPDHPSPDTLEPGTIYVVASAGHPKWAYLRNPADKADVLQLSLMKNRRPCWKVSSDLLGRATVHPSIRQLDGAHAHFWVKKGGITWCQDTGMPTTGTPARESSFDRVNLAPRPWRLRIGP